VYSVILKKIPVKYLIVAGIGICAVLVALIIALVSNTEPEPPRYALETSGGEPNFEEAVFHTAEDGIAVVGGAKSAVDESEVPLAPSASFLTADLESIWDGVTEAELPVGSFTPVSAIADSENQLGTLSIPAIGVEAPVFESGDNMADMSHGVAHFPHSSVWDGNVCFSAHNVNFDGSQGYFYALHTLKPGDEITYSTSAGERTYSVSEITEIDEMDWSDLMRTDENRLTLVTCITGKQDMRLCVRTSEITA
jgi:LPXTG-site transpeptidase (sortase) family protein